MYETKCMYKWRCSHLYCVKQKARVTRMSNTSAEKYIRNIELTLDKMQNSHTRECKNRAMCGYRGAEEKYEIAFDGGIRRHVR